jgi:hypothetical protein
MKKIVIFFITAILTLFISSCSKDISSLGGTTWIGAGGRTAMQITFTQSEFELKDMNAPVRFYGTYAYNPPTVTFIVTKYIDIDSSQRNGGASMTGTVSGNTMTLTYEGASTVATFVKQK